MICMMVRMILINKLLWKNRNSSIYIIKHSAAFIFSFGVQAGVGPLLYVDGLKT